VQFRFHFEKAMQAAGVLLSLDGDRMESIRLLKLLYVADREMLAEIGSPITGDRAVAMKHGPVLVQVYDLIKGRDARAGEWSDAFRTSDHNIEMRKPIGRGKLNRDEVDKLREVTDRFRDHDAWEICDITHAFPEWRDTYEPDTARPISWAEALKAQGRADQIPLAEREETLRSYLDEVFGA